MNKTNIPLLFFFLLIWNACASSDRQSNAENVHFGGKDGHSYANTEMARTVHLDLDIRLDFDKKMVVGTTTWEIAHEKAKYIIFDSYHLDIRSVKIGNGESEQKAKYNLSKADPVFGQALKVNLAEDTRFVTIEYATEPNAAALIWLDKEQTLGKELPYFLSNGFSIKTRSWIPCQDSPGVRFSYDANVQVPVSMVAVMSAEKKGPYTKSVDGRYTFSMPQPVPAYLLALAAGDIMFERLNSRMGIYTEPLLIDDAHYEFDRVGAMMSAAEKLFGPYKWDRFDILVVPNSFPFGGMENPRLTFVSPSLIVGDRSMTTTVAHELAHAWSGNLVTNETWEDFWLNEGITSYMEYRIMEEVEGEEYAKMLMSIGVQELKEQIDAMGKDNEDTQLKLSLEGRNPDEALTSIAYEKGALFMRLLEKIVGRAKFDEFLRKYFEEFKFKTISTEQFESFLASHLEVDFEKNRIKEWLYAPGLPDNMPMLEVDAFEKVELQITRVLNGESIGRKDGIKSWNALEVQHFLSLLPKTLDNRAMKSLDLNFNFSVHKNWDIRAKWFEISIYNGYASNERIARELERFLFDTGRTKHLFPIYKAFVERGQTENALQIYTKARSFYSSICTTYLDELLAIKKN